MTVATTRCSLGR